MAPNWIIALVVLLFHAGLTLAKEQTVNEGQEVELRCHPPETGTLIIWFRVLDGSGMDFIASFGSLKKELKKTSPSYSSFSASKISSNVLTLKSFKKNIDSGIYSCASLIKGNEVKFGEVTRIGAKKTRVEPPPRVKTTVAEPVTTQLTTPCVCSSQPVAETDPSMSCSLMILAPLAGGCGLLLLLLIVTVLYCNRIRTRRCPHHHKRKPRTMALDKQMMQNRHI